MSKTMTVLTAAVMVAAGLFAVGGSPADAREPQPGKPAYRMLQTGDSRGTHARPARHRCSASRAVCSVYRHAAYMARNAHGSRSGAPYHYSKAQIRTIKRRRLVVPSVRAYNHPRARLRRSHGHAYRGSRLSRALAVNIAPWGDGSPDDRSRPLCQMWRASALQDSAVFGDVLFVANFRVEVCFREMTGAGGSSGRIVSAFPDLFTTERHGTIYQRGTTHHDTHLPAWRYRDHTTAEYESCVFRYGCWASYYPNFDFLVGRLDRMRTGCWRGSQFHCWILEPSLLRLSMYWS